jgi:hypothetical protein
MRQADPFFYVPSVVAPAPWHLRGNGYVFLFRHSRAFLWKNGFLSDYQRAHLKAGIGAVILADYQESDVGPYRELMFIPGIFKISGHYTFSISKIYVSTQDSRWNGVENWGLPKEVADFSILAGKERNNEETWVVSRNQKPFFSVNLHRRSFGFPVSSALVPFRIGQVFQDSLMLTEPSVKARGQFVRTDGWYTHSDYFPPIDPSSLITGVSLRDFKMKFPAPSLFRAD